jgi:transcriptional regulator with XRE-family HTH domain
VTIDRKRLVRLRQSRLLSRAQLAAKMTEAGYSITPDAIAKIENGYRRPKTATLKMLCEALGCTPEDLLPAEEPAQDDPPARYDPGQKNQAIDLGVCRECGARFGHEPGCPHAT